MPNIDIAFSEDAVKELFNTARDSVNITKSGSSNGAFRASYNVGVRLEGGDIDLKDSPDEIKISELDVVYDPLNVTLEVDIPEVCVGGFCIIPKPWPWSGCLVRAPRICLFSANPDISIPLNLDGLIQSEISGGFKPVIKFFDNPAGTGLNQYQAYAANALDKWQLFLEARWLDLDIIDFADTIGNILDAIIDNFINNIFGGLPGWARDILSWLLNGISDIIRGILDIGDDIDEWLSDLLGVSFGLFDFILEKVANHFLSDTTLYEVDTPYPIVPGSTPVLLPIHNVAIDIKDDEIVLSVDI
ncbi:hypothetical protein [Lacinutrix salivirga]